MKRVPKRKTNPNARLLGALANGALLDLHTGVLER